MADSSPAFFDHVGPIYPIIDQTEFRAELHQYYQSLVNTDRLWLLQAKLMMCVGAVAVRDQTDLPQDIKELRETIFNQVMSTAYLIYCHGKARNIQILILIVSPSLLATLIFLRLLWSRLSTASRPRNCKAHGCGAGGGSGCSGTTSFVGSDRSCLTRRKTHSNYGTSSLGPCSSSKGKLYTIDVILGGTWSSFYSSQLSLISFHDDPRLTEAMIRQPTEEMKDAHPIFCHRLALARMSHKVSGVYLESTPDPLTFCKHIEEMYNAIGVWKDELPVSYITHRYSLHATNTFLSPNTDPSLEYSARKRNISTSC